MFQSSPVTKDGRYPAIAQVPVRAVCFNPRPSLRTGATQGKFATIAARAFQSSPVTKDGRYRVNKNP